MGRFKEISYEISEEIKKREEEMEDHEVLEILEDIRSDSEFCIEGKSKTEDKVYIDEIAAIDRAIDSIKNGLSKEKDYIVGLVCMLVLMLVTIFTTFGTCEKYKKQLKEVVEVRQNDLDASKEYIKENNELKRQYEELEKKYNYAVEVIRTTDKYEMPDELEE